MSKTRNAHPKWKGRSYCCSSSSPWIALQRTTVRRCTAESTQRTSTEEHTKGNKWGMSVRVLGADIASLSPATLNELMPRYVQEAREWIYPKHSDATCEWHSALREWQWASRSRLLECTFLLLRKSLDARVKDLSAKGLEEVSSANNTRHGGWTVGQGNIHKPPWQVPARQWEIMQELARRFKAS